MIEVNSDMAQKLGLLMQLAENDTSPTAIALRAVFSQLVNEVKGKTTIGLLAIDFLNKASDMKDPIYTDFDPMLKQSIKGMMKSVQMMLEET